MRWTRLKLSIRSGPRIRRPTPNPMWIVNPIACEITKFQRSAPQRSTRRAKAHATIVTTTAMAELKAKVHTHCSQPCGPPRSRVQFGDHQARQDARNAAASRLIAASDGRPGTAQPDRDVAEPP